MTKLNSTKNLQLGQTLENKRLMYAIATYNDLLEKEDQTKEWYVFREAVDILKYYKETYPELASEFTDKSFTYFNNTLVTAVFDKIGNKSNKDYLRIKRGLKASERLLFSNMRLIIKIVNDFDSSGNFTNDLIQAGIQGFMKALVSFKPYSEPKKNLQLNLFEEVEEEAVREYKVSSYAFFWIKNFVRRELYSLKGIKDHKDTSTFLPLDLLNSSEASELNPEIDWYALVKSNPEELDILESTPIEIAMDRKITIESAELLKKDTAEKIKKYLTS